MKSWQHYNQNHVCFEKNFEKVDLASWSSPYIQMNHYSRHNLGNDFIIISHYWSRSGRVLQVNYPINSQQLQWTLRIEE
jgi:hypothetical protein